MITRIFSWGSRSAALFVTVAICGATASGQERPGYFTDPATGIVYRQVTRSVERPVVETKIEQQEQTVYRPETVKETRPETKTVFTPVTEYQWQTYVQGRWNPFRQPTVAYKPVPQTRWEARSEVINRTQTRTQWVAEKRTVDVPHRIVRMDREQKVEYEVVGRVCAADDQSERGAASDRISITAAGQQHQRPAICCGRGNVAFTSSKSICRPTNRGDGRTNDQRSAAPVDQPKRAADNRVVSDGADRLRQCVACR